MTVTDPNGTDYDSLPMIQGRILRVENPVSGEWVVNISVGGDVFVDSECVLSAFSFNRVMGMSASVDRRTDNPGEAIQVFALPRSLEGVFSHPTESVWARVIRPEGSEDSLELHDRGRDRTGAKSTICKAVHPVCRSRETRRRRTISRRRSRQDNAMVGRLL